MENQVGEFIDNSIEKKEKSFYERINTIRTNKFFEVNFLERFSNLKSMTLIKVNLTEEKLKIIKELNLIELILIGLNIDDYV